MKRVLFFAYYFPPTGGAGVQRAVKFVKYLPEFGYQCSVVAGLDSKLFVNLELDHSLHESLNCYISRITLNRFEAFQYKIFNQTLRRYFPFAAMRWWKTSARRALEHAVKESKPDVIITTVSPFMSADVTADIARKYNIPWVLDMRDPWALDPINYYPSYLHYTSDLRNMHRACKSANAVIMNTPDSLKALRDTFADVDQQKTFCITNGWDDEDFVASVRNYQLADGPLKIVHTGVFHTQNALKLDPASRKAFGVKEHRIMDCLRYSAGNPHLLARTPFYLLKSIRQLIDAEKIQKNDIKLIFAGANTSSDIEMARKFNLEDVVEFKGYLNHDDSVNLLSDSDVLFLPLHIPTKGSRNPLIVPGKVYEYMASGKPILSLVPEGDCRNFLERYGNSFICDPADCDSISNTIVDIVSRRKNKVLNEQMNVEFTNQFKRKELSVKLKQVLDFAIEK